MSDTVQIKNSQTEPKLDSASVCPNRRHFFRSKPKTIFFSTTKRQDEHRLTIHNKHLNTGDQGGSSGEGYEEMEEHEEMEEDSTSNV